MGAYDRRLQWVLKHQPLMRNHDWNYLSECLPFHHCAQRFFPYSRIRGCLAAPFKDPRIFRSAMKQKSQQYAAIVAADPAVQIVSSTLGGGTISHGNMTIGLKTLAERKISSDQVIRSAASLAPWCGNIVSPDLLYYLPVRRRQSNSQYQFTLESEDLNDLYSWAPRVPEKLKTLPELQRRKHRSADDGSRNATRH